jgi:hypothetical protein
LIGSSSSATPHSPWRSAPNWRSESERAMCSWLRHGLGELILYGPDAETLREQHRLRQERFGNSSAAGPISVVESKPTSEHLRETLEDDQHPVLILADDPALAGPHRATYLAALNPTWTIFDWSPTTRGVADQPIMVRLYPFGLTMDAPSL